MCQLTPVSRGAPGVLAAIDQLPVLQEGKGIGKCYLQQAGRGITSVPTLGKQRDLTSYICPLWGPCTLWPCGETQPQAHCH